MPSFKTIHKGFDQHHRLFNLLVKSQTDDAMKITLQMTGIKNPAIGLLENWNINFISNKISLISSNNKIFGERAEKFLKTWICYNIIQFNLYWTLCHLKAWPLTIFRASSQLRVTGRMSAKVLKNGIIPMLGHKIPENKNSGMIRPTPAWMTLIEKVSKNNIFKCKYWYFSGLISKNGNVLLSWFQKN